MLFISIVLLPTSCESMFDRQTPPHSLSGENAISDEASAETALNGIYSYFQTYGGPFDAYYIANNEFRAGMMKGYYRGAFDDNNNAEFKVTYESSYISTPWYNAYDFINTVNCFIYYIEKADDNNFAEGKKQEMIAEARFVRAFMNSYLLKMFGYSWDINSEYGNVLRLEPASLSNNAKARSTVAETYNSIFEDYDYAIQYGPDKYSTYRGSAVSAKAFKAEMLMNRGADGDYAEAIKLADEVILSTEVGLESSYADIFANGYNSKELLFSHYIKEPEKQIGMNTGTIYKMMTEGVYEPTDAYLEIFNSSDARFNVSMELKPITSGSLTVDQYVWKKHYVEDADCPMYYMRVAQLYLIKAEAMLNNGSSTSEILSVLNVLRGRSGNHDLKSSDYSNKYDVQNVIFYEAVREIGSENDALYYMLIRMKDSTGKRCLASYNSYYTTDAQLCYQIPKDEITYNSLIKQNPEY